MLSKLVDIDEPSKDKNDSRDCHLSISEKAQKVIVELNSMHGQAKEKILELIDILKNEDKLKDHQIKRVLFETVDFVSQRTLYRALPQELKKVTKPAKPLPKTINVAHKVIDVPSEEREQYNPEEEIKKIGEIRRAEWQANEDDDDEDPKDLEIAFLKEKVIELEEALKKTQQFTPANIVPLVPKEEQPLTDEITFQWIQKKADGIHSFFYDAYGIDLFKNRELPQLKNSGVKVFRRLYFEV